MDEPGLKEIVRLSHSAIIPGRRWPHQVFHPDFGHFCFIEQSEFSGAEFWCLLQKLAAWSGDSEVIVLAPDAVETFSQGFGDTGVLVAPAWFTSHDYYAGLDRKVVKDGRFSDLIHKIEHSLFSPSLRWAMWGEFHRSILVLGFRGEPPAELEQWAAECGIRLWPIEEALNSLTRLDFGVYNTPTYKPSPEAIAAFNAFKQEFLRNYNR